MNSMNDSGDFQDVESNFLWKVVSRFQSTCNDSEFSFVVSAATNACHLAHGMRLDHRKNFFR